MVAHSCAPMVFFTHTLSPTRPLTSLPQAARHDGLYRSCTVAPSADLDNAVMASLAHVVPWGSTPVQPEPTQVARGDMELADVSGAAAAVVAAATMTAIIVKRPSVARRIDLMTDTCHAPSVNPRTDVLHGAY